MLNRNRSALHAQMIGQLRTFSSGAILFNQMVAECVGLHLTDMQCMNLLDLLGTSTPGKLAEFMGLTTGGVTVMLDRLEKTGCIKREPNPDDRRSVLVRVNARKMEKINAQYAGVADQLDAYIRKVPEAELEIVVEFFKKMNAIRVSAAIGAETRGQRT
jgi:MarR family transcriptional regulator, organic hydroperoxide resistance regulator